MRLVGPWLIVLLVSAAVQGQLTNQLVFDETDFASVDGLVVDGVRFFYQLDGVSSPEAYYHSVGPGTLTYVDDPSLTGLAAGQLTLEFIRPTTVVSFGVALSTGDALDDGVFIDLFDRAGLSVGSFAVDTIASGPLGFSEGLFSYEGNQVGTAVVRFAAGVDSFALDNLVYEVPEPFVTPGWLMVAVLFGWRRRPFPLRVRG